jgi:hypothetical protein
MAHAVRTAWKAHRQWVAAGFLLSTSLFLLLVFLNWRSEQFGISQQSGTGLSATTATTWDLRSQWSQRSLLPVSRSKQGVRMVDFAKSTAGGVPGGVPPAAFTPRLESPAEQADRQVIRSGTLEIIASDPAQAAEQLRNLATHLSGFVVNSKVSGSDERMQSAQVTVRIPAEHFDEARAQVRVIAKSVEQDVVEARDVTREYVDQEAALRNARAEEQQYLLILKRAWSVNDVLEVDSKLAEVRAHIDELQGDLRFLRQQVDMSLLTINITAMADTQVFGIRWRPRYKAKLSLRGALSGMADCGDSMVELLVNLPVIAIWGFTILALLKVGWMVLRRTVLLFFPALGTWLRRPVQPQAT